MKPPRFDYERPTSLDEAVAVLVANEGAKVLAGGQSLIPMMNFRLASPPVLVDISRIPDMEQIAVADGQLSIGGLVTHQAVAASSEVVRVLPVVAEAAALIGHLAIRNRGTVGGSLAHSDPAAEWPLLCRLVDSRIRVHGPQGPGIVPGDQLNVGFLETCLGEHDILTGVDFTLPPPDSCWAFVEFTRRHGDFALAMVGVNLGINSDAITDPRVVLGALDSTPIRAHEVEEALVGQPPTDETFDAAAALAAEVCNPVDDVHATAGYRRHLATVLTARALRAARDRERMR